MGLELAQCLSMGKGHEFCPHWAFLDEGSFQGTCGHRTVMIHTSHLHTQMAGFDDHTHTLGLKL